MPHVTDPVAGPVTLPPVTREETILQYVKHDDVPRYQSAGWTISDTLADVHHGEYAVLMVWDGEGEPE